MIGGDGNDTYTVDLLGDSVTENADEGTADTVRSATMNLNAFFYTNVENFTLTGSGNLNINGDENDNTLTGNSGNNILIGGGGTDHLFGGAGNDIYEVDGSEDFVSDDSNPTGGIDTVRSQSISLDVSHYSNVENLTLTGSANLDLVGDSETNVLTGNSGNNSLYDGNGGGDFLIGGLGDDTYQNDGGSAQVIETASGGNDTVQSFNQHLDLGSTRYLNVENARLLGSLDLFLTGNGFANVLNGNSGNNTISGNGGADTMIGGDGNDTFDVDVAGDVVRELVGQGTDTVQSSTISLSLANYANVENLTLLGAANLNLTGSAVANVLTGNTGANTLIGGAGADRLDGGLGIDTVSYATSVLGVNVNLATGVVSGGDAQGDVLISIENIIGSNAANVLTGNTLANALSGGGGNDVLSGGAGADRLDGGLGVDTVSYATSALGVNVNLATGVVRGGEAQGDVLISIENIIGSNAVNVLTGNTLANALSGGGGNDVLNGGLGNDVLSGGLGSDNFIFNTALNASLNNDTITDFSSSAAGNNDTIRLENQVFTTLAGANNTRLSATQFFAGAAAHDLDDRIIYNQATGALLYDADGNKVGGVAAIQFATLGTTVHPATLSNADFFIF